MSAVMVPVVSITNLARLVMQKVLKHPAHSCFETQKNDMCFLSERPLEVLCLMTEQCHADGIQFCLEKETLS